MPEYFLHPKAKRVTICANALDPAKTEEVENYWSMASQCWFHYLMGDKKAVRELHELFKNESNLDELTRITLLCQERQGDEAALTEAIETIVAMIEKKEGRDISTMVNEVWKCYLESKETHDSGKITQFNEAFNFITPELNKLAEIYLVTEDQSLIKSGVEIIETAIRKAFPMF